MARRQNKDASTKTLMNLVQEDSRGVARNDTDLAVASVAALMRTETLTCSSQGHIWKHMSYIFCDLVVRAPGC
jgi:hypothetical protein